MERYCENTSLHGLRYVGDRSLSIFERMFWLISFSVAIGFAAYYITNIFQKWNSSPVIISFSPFDADLKSIPFPAVTICNMNQAKRTEVNKIIAEGNPRDLKLLDDLCVGNKSNQQPDNYTEQYDWKNLRNFLIRVGSSCNEMMKACKWTNDKKNCDELFNNDLTDEGLCCSFNRLPYNKIFRNPNEISLLNQTYPENVYDWNPEIGFSNVGDYDNENMVPRRPLGAGAHLGLSVLLDAQIDEYYCSSTSSVGFKIIVSNPIETPKMADYGTLLSPGVEARFSIKPSIREASKNLRSIPLQKRQCYFASERKLVYYRKYTQVNCLQECLSTFIYNRCNCSPYYLPKNFSMRYCQEDDDVCVEAAKKIVDKADHGEDNCYCYEECNSVNYKWKLTFSKLSMSVPNKYYFLNSTLESNGLLLLHFFFDEVRFEKIMKDRLYNLTDLIAYIGGLLAVFLGFSIFSFIELIYYITSSLMHVFFSYIEVKNIDRNRN
ncbi:pickpocket protein 28-like [Diorhabda carinulata]|uniref:pickpocket protein 28-like n=1 Tax=Diorhabda carinulata TaxID=1163345 RepID=UPI0025A211F3|nr:pickpocket protein 28-like [Diorhabda carinulata]